MFADFDITRHVSPSAGWRGPGRNSSQSFLSVERPRRRHPLLRSVDVSTSLCPYSARAAALVPSSPAFAKKRTRAAILCRMPGSPHWPSNPAASGSLSTETTPGLRVFAGVCLSDRGGAAYCSHGAVRRSRTQRSEPCITPHRGVTTTFTKCLALLRTWLNSVAAGVSPADREATDMVATTEGAPMLWNGERALPLHPLKRVSAHSLRIGALYWVTVLPRPR